MSPQTVTGHFLTKLQHRGVCGKTPNNNLYVPLAEHLTRPVVLREPTEVLSQPWGPFMHSRSCCLRLFDILYHTVFARRSPPAACNSSSFLSIHQVLVSMQALLLARAGVALAICLCPHPSSNPYSLQSEEVKDRVNEGRVRKCDLLIETSREDGKAQ